MSINQVVSANDARQRLRVRCNAKVHVESGDRRTISGTLRDVCLNSLYLFANDSRDDFFILGENVKVKVIMERDNSTLTIALHGHVARMDDSGFAVRFSESLCWWPVFVIFPSQNEH